MAAEYTANYEFEHKQLEAPRLVTVRSVAIQHNSRYYLMRMLSDASSPRDFSTFVDNIRLI
jgi:hypothetical protein